MSRPYPWPCAECGARAVQPETISHRSEVKHENVLHEVVVHDLPVHKCQACGEVYMGEDADEAIRTALRVKLGLLLPATIRSCRNDLQMDQEELAELCGFAGESWSRWERGAVHSRATDNLMRVVFGVPAARVFLEKLKVDRTLGERVLWTTSTATNDPYATPHVFGLSAQADSLSSLRRKRRTVEPKSAASQLPALSDEWKIAA